MDTDLIYIVAQHVRCAYDRDGGTLLDIRRGEMHTLNSVASSILRRIENSASFSEMVAGVQGDFHISQEVARSDVYAFLETLVSHGFVETCSE